MHVDPLGHCYSSVTQESAKMTAKIPAFTDIGKATRGAHFSGVEADLYVLHQVACLV